VHQRLSALVARPSADLPQPIALTRRFLRSVAPDLAAAVALVFWSGCAAVGVRSSGPSGTSSPPIYMGVSEDLYILRGETMLPAAVGLFDLPFTAVVDTMLIPYDLATSKKK